MKGYQFLTGSIFKFLFVWSILAFLTLSTTLESLSLLTENSFEIEHIDWQEDTSEESERKKKRIPKFITSLNHPYHFYRLMRLA
jgi:hypothetical protein